MTTITAVTTTTTTELDTETKRIQGMEPNRASERQRTCRAKYGEELQVKR